MKFKYASVGLAAAALIAGGCLGGYRAVKYYDMQQPPQFEKTALPVKTGAFVNATPVRQRMMFRTAQDELLQDEYNRFAQSPELMLARYLAVAFGEHPNGGDGASAQFTIYGTLFLFDFNAETLEAQVGVDYTIELRNPDETGEKAATGNVIFRSQALSAEPDVVARAFSRCMLQLANHLYDVINRLPSGR